MPWFYVDDGFPDCVKLAAIPEELLTAAVGLWTLAGSWSRKKLTGGFVPTGQVRRLGGTVEEAQALVDCGLWEADLGGYRFHDWADWQETPEEVEVKRSQERAKKQAWRRKRQGQSPPSPPPCPPACPPWTSTGQTPMSTGESRPCPGPVPGDPSPSPDPREPLATLGGSLPACAPANDSSTRPAVDVMGLQLAIGKAADELDWETAPEVMPGQLAQAARRVPGLAKCRGKSLDEAAHALARAALLRSRATGQGVGFALLEVDPAQPVPKSRGHPRNPRMERAEGTTGKDFADADVEAQLARIGRPV